MTNLDGVSSVSSWGDEEAARARQHIDSTERDAELGSADEQTATVDATDLETEDQALIASNELHPHRTPEELLRNEQDR